MSTAIPAVVVAESAAAIGLNVVTENVSLTPPIVTTASLVVVGVAALVTRTATVAPGGTDPAALVKAPPFTEYWPPVIVMGAPVLVPVIVTFADVTAVLSPTSVWSVKLKASGVLSAGTVVTEKVSDTPPTVRTVFVVVEPVAALGCRTVTC
jgi:hypothetical protein